MNTNGHLFERRKYLKCLICGINYADFENVYILPGYDTYREYFCVSQIHLYLNNINEIDNQLLCWVCSNDIGINCNGVYVFDTTKVAVR